MKQHSLNFMCWHAVGQGHPSWWSQTIVYILFQRRFRFLHCHFFYQIIHVHDSRFSNKSFTLHIGNRSDISSQFSFYRRALLEMKLNSSDVSEEERQNLLKELERTETEYMRIKRQKFCVDDFELLTIIGRGAFGEVLYVYFLCALWS